MAYRPARYPSNSSCSSSRPATAVSDRRCPTAVHSAHEAEAVPRRPVCDRASAALSSLRLRRSSAARARRRQGANVAPFQGHFAPPGSDGVHVAARGVRCAAATKRALVEEDRLASVHAVNMSNSGRETRQQAHPRLDLRHVRGLGPLRDSIGPAGAGALRVGHAAGRAPPGRGARAGRGRGVARRRAGARAPAHRVRERARGRCARSMGMARRAAGRPPRALRGRLGARRPHEGQRGRPRPPRERRLARALLHLRSGLRRGGRRDGARRGDRAVRVARGGASLRQGERDQHGHDDPGARRAERPARDGVRRAARRPPDAQAHGQGAADRRGPARRAARAEPARRARPARDRDQRHVREPGRGPRARRLGETSARIAMLEQLRHADRLTTVGKLASGIAHELGTPLNVVSGRA
jgi:signal transduction histidine kinase